MVASGPPGCQGWWAVEGCVGKVEDYGEGVWGERKKKGHLRGSTRDECLPRSPLRVLHHASVPLHRGGWGMQIPGPRCEATAAAGAAVTASAAVSF